MRKHLALLGLFVTSFGCSYGSPTVVRQGSGQTAAVKAPGRYVETIEIDGVKRSFIMRVPKQYDGKPIPVVMVLHGWTSSAAQAEQYTKMGAQSEKSGFIAVFPDGLGKQQGWNAGFINLTGIQKVDDVKFLTSVLDKVEKELNIDLAREYVCGHSNGAFMSNLLGSELSNRLAAFGSVAGTVGIGSKTVPTPDAPLSVILIHGKKDPMVAYSKESRAVLMGIGAEESARWWARANGCTPDPKVIKSTDGNVITAVYDGGRGDSVVELVSIENGDHSWPGGLTATGPEKTTGADAAQILWDFFASHPRKRG